MPDPVRLMNELSKQVQQTAESVLTVTKAAGRMTNDVKLLSDKVLELEERVRRLENRWKQEM